MVFLFWNWGRLKKLTKLISIVLTGTHMTTTLFWRGKFFLLFIYLNTVHYNWKKTTSGINSGNYIRSADNTVRMFDRRNLEAAVHTFEGHSAAVLCVQVTSVAFDWFLTEDNIFIICFVLFHCLNICTCLQWCPDKSSVFGSSAEDGLLNIWDHQKVNSFNWFDFQISCLFAVKLNIGVRFSSFFPLQVGKKPSSKSHPTGLFFRHAGHRYKAINILNNLCLYD